MPKLYPHFNDCLSVAINRDQLTFIVALCLVEGLLGVITMVVFPFYWRDFFSLSPGFMFRVVVKRSQVAVITSAILTPILKIMKMTAGNEKCNVLTLFVKIVSHFMP